MVRWLFSSSPIGSAPPSSSFGAHHLSCAPTTPPCHYTSLFRQSPSLAHFVRATRRVFGVPMENDELEANVIVVDDDVQATWLELVPGQHQLPQPAPPYGMSIVCCVEENGTTAVDNLPTVTVWWWKMPSTRQSPGAALDGRYTKTVNRYTEIHSVSDSQADTHQIHTHVRAVPSSRNGLLDTVFLKTFSAFVRERDAPMQHRTPWNPNPDRAKRSGAATAPAETRVMD